MLKLQIFIVHFGRLASTSSAHRITSPTGL